MKKFLSMFFVIGISIMSMFLTGCSLGESKTNYCEIFVTSNNQDYGKTYGSGKYASDQDIEVIAIPNKGYHFIKWNDNKTVNPRTIHVDKGWKDSYEIKAIFEKDEDAYKLDTVEIYIKNVSNDVLNVNLSNLKIYSFDSNYNTTLLGGFDYNGKDSIDKGINFYEKKDVNSLSSTFVQESNPVILYTTSKNNYFKGNNGDAIIVNWDLTIKLDKSIPKLVESQSGSIVFDPKIIDKDNVIYTYKIDKLNEKFDIAIKPHFIKL